MRVGILRSETKQSSKIKTLMNVKGFLIKSLITIKGMMNINIATMADTPIIEESDSRRLIRNPSKTSKVLFLFTNIIDMLMLKRNFEMTILCVHPYYGEEIRQRAF